MGWKPGSAGLIIGPTREGDEMKGALGETGTSMDGARQLQVPARCEGLGSEIEKLGAVCDRLEGRLKDVLRPDAPETAESRMKEAQVGLVPLADELESFYQKLARLTRNVDSMISRLEV